MQFFNKGLVLIIISIEETLTLTFFYDKRQIALLIKETLTGYETITLFFNESLSFKNDSPPKLLWGSDIQPGDIVWLRHFTFGL